MASRRRPAPGLRCRLTPTALRALAALAALAAPLAAPAGASAAGSAFARAQEPEAAIDSLVTLALRENPRLAALAADHASALASVPRAGALPDPTLSISFEGMPLDEPSPGAAVERSLMLEQMLPFPGKQGLMKAMQSDAAAMAGLRLARARLEVASEMRAALQELIRRRAAIEIVEESRDALAQIVEASLARYITGSAGQPELLKMQVELAMEETRLAALRLQLPAAEARVNALLDRPAGATLPQLGDPDLPRRGPAGLAPLAPLDSCEARALALQPMLAMEERAVAMAERGLGLARREAWPDLMLGAGYMAMKEMDDAWMGRIGLTLPVWRGNKVAPSRREAEQRLLSARESRDQARNETLLAVREAHAMAAAAREMLLLYDDSVLPQAERALAAARSAYETGAVGSLDLLDARRSLLAARLARADARAEYATRLAGLALAIGEGAGGRAPER